jgi:hypothetical protein
MQINKEKRIIYKSFWKFTGLVIIGCLFTVAGAVTFHFYLVVFFLFVTLFIAFPLIDPRNKVIWIGSKKYKESLAGDIESSKAKMEKRREEPGIFSYHDNCFEITYNKKQAQYNWNQTVSMVAYKRDDFTTDCICLDVFCDGNIYFGINEDTKGWHQFIASTKEQFPQINKNWDWEITTPAFQKNLTLVYDREGRTLEEVIKTHYPAKKT